MFPGRQDEHSGNLSTAGLLPALVPFKKCISGADHLLKKIEKNTLHLAKECVHNDDMPNTFSRLLSAVSSQISLVKASSTVRRQANGRAGFTLIELLVVIAIIAILVAIGVTAFSAAQRAARDSTRRADIRNIQSGFEQYFLVNGAYAACGTMLGDATLFPEGEPTDPGTGASYSCAVDTALTTYAVLATLEDPGSGNSCGFGTTSGTCSFSCGTTSQDTFCVQALQ